jgi:hypothetical protein
LFSAIGEVNPKARSLSWQDGSDGFGGRERRCWR